MIKKFLKRLFCRHEYGEIIDSTQCYHKVTCNKCGKIKKVTTHEYKLMDSFYKTKSCSSISVNDETTYLKQIFKCIKCGDITVRTTLI